MTIRPATGDDVAAVHAIEQELFGPDAWSVESVREELTGGRRSAVVACDPDLVGYAVTMTAGDLTDLQRIGVRHDWRRTGLAHRLLDAVAGEGPLLLEVSETNAGARAFYASEGFTEIDRRRRYYRDGSDALVLRRAGAGPSGPGESHVVTGLLRRGDRVLLCHRTPDRRWYPDVWDLPGGHVEEGESAAQALVRELHEELGVRVPAPGEPLTHRTGAGFRMDVWLVEEWAGHVVNHAPEEHDGLRWCDLREARRLSLAHPWLLELVAGVLREQRAGTERGQWSA